MFDQQHATCNMQHATRGGGICAPTAPCIPFALCSRVVSLCGGPHGRVHCALSGRRGYRLQGLLELVCWEGVEGVGEGFATRISAVLSPPLAVIT